jgi:hypothetical protein
MKTAIVMMQLWEAEILEIESARTSRNREAKTKDWPAQVSLIPG